MKAVLISIRPKPNPPLKVYIYCTKDAKRQFWTGSKYSYVDDRSHNAFDKCGSGKVIGCIEEKWRLSKNLEILIWKQNR